jgi:RNA ligase
MTVIPWTEIESFHNVRKYTQAHPEILNDNPVVTYRAKVKLHGTNAGVQVLTGGKVVAQSRTAELSVGNDNAGFAKWVDSNKEYWNKLPENIIVFGEWCGPGIQKGVAISEIPKKIFAVFAVRFISEILDDVLMFDPVNLQYLVKDIPDTYVLPWYNDEIQIDWSASSENLTKSVNDINQWVNEVEKNDPWVENTFNVKGTGEGLVFYPTDESHASLVDFNNLVFKAKGEKHKNIKTAAPAQVNPEAASGIEQFADLVLTAARLEQGAMAVMEEPIVAMLTFDMKRIGKFLAWIAADVQKETQDELAASNLTWSQVSKAVSNKARTWYLEKAKAL